MYIYVQSGVTMHFAACAQGTRIGVNVDPGVYHTSVVGNNMYTVAYRSKHNVIIFLVLESGYQENSTGLS